MKVCVKKVAQRFAGKFKVLERVSSLTYKLDLPNSWKIHPVIFFVGIASRGLWSLALSSWCWGFGRRPERFPFGGHIGGVIDERSL